MWKKADFFKVVFFFSTLVVGDKNFFVFFGFLFICLLSYYFHCCEIAVYADYFLDVEIKRVVIK